MKKTPGGLALGLKPLSGKAIKEEETLPRNHLRGLLAPLFTLPSRLAENALENFVGYSRSLYEVASTAQSEYSRLAEQRMAAFQQAFAETVDQAAKSAPAGGDVAVAAIKSQLAAATAAFDSFTKAARHVASYADAGVTAARPAKSRK